jgi:hypothetical protein
MEFVGVHRSLSHAGMHANLQIGQATYIKRNTLDLNFKEVTPILLKWGYL